MKVSPILFVVLALTSLSLPACEKLKGQEQESHAEQHKIVVTSPENKDVAVAEPYVCLIQAQNNINVCPLVSGYIEEIHVKEGQAVKKGELMFKIQQSLYKTKFDAEWAEAQSAQLEFNNTAKLFNEKVVSQQEVAIQQAKLNKALARAKQAEAELSFTMIRAPFDGLVDRLEVRPGSQVKEGEILTTLSDNSVMWVYFNTPEARYLSYMAELGASVKDIKDYQSRLVAMVAELNQRTKFELELADGSKFEHIGKLGTIEAKCNRETGNFTFRADFPNPEGLLRHGQTGTVLIHRTMKNALVIPQRATFEILDRRYVYVVGKDDVVHQREIVIQRELDDIFVIKEGVAADDRIVLEGVRQVRDGEKVESEFRQSDQVLGHQKNKAE